MISETVRMSSFLGLVHQPRRRSILSLVWGHGQVGDMKVAADREGRLSVALLSTSGWQGKGVQVIIRGRQNR